MSINKIVTKEKKWHDERYRDGEDKRININIASRIAWYPYSKFYKKIKDINSSKVLEIGCGNSLLKAKQFISQGCRYTGIDISEECINANIKDAIKLGLNVNYLVDDAHVLNKLKNEKFDIILIMGTLHHLDIDLVLPKLDNHLKKNGSVLLWEPMGTNPFLNLYRFFTPEIRTEDEHPLTFKDIKKLKKHFKNTSFELHTILAFLSLPFFIFKYKPIEPLGKNISYLLGKIDKYLCRIPLIRRLAWIILIDAKK